MHIEKKRHLSDVIDLMRPGDYMKWDVISTKPSSEPQSDRELMMVIINEMRHFADTADDIKIMKTEFQDLKNKVESMNEAMKELKCSLKDMDTIQDDLRASHERFNTYFKIIGTISIAFPTLLLGIFEIIL